MMKKAPNGKHFEEILVIILGLMIIFFLTGNSYFAKIAVVVGILSVLFEAVAARISYSWRKLSEVLGWINSRILLSLIYFVVLVPIAVLARVFQKKKDPLQLRKRANESYFIILNRKYMAKDFENLW